MVLTQTALAPPVVEEHGGVLVVRDDLLPGGTKTRPLPGLLDRWPEQEFVFGGPAEGLAQVALALGCQAVGKRATVFVAERKVLSGPTSAAEQAGARVVQVPAGRLTVVQHRARTYAAKAGARFLPLGFDVPEFVAAFGEIAAAMPVEPREVWCAAGTGALSRGLQRAWPYVPHYAVRVGFEPRPGIATVMVAPEEFAEPARFPPPFPSNRNYDAKVWQFVKDRPGALFWNVAA